MGGRGKEELVLWGVESSEQENESSAETAITNLISSKVLRQPSRQNLPTGADVKHHPFLFLINMLDQFASP